MQSTDMNVKDASEKISEMTNINDITIFIAGDERIKNLRENISHL
jgi:hypothetical protein